MHWQDSSDEYTLSMDVSNEKFIKIHLPDGGNKIDSHKYALMEFDGHLSSVHNVSNTKSIFGYWKIFIVGFGLRNTALWQM